MSTRHAQPQLMLDLSDLVLINNALNEIINGPAAIDTAECQARTGATIEEAERLLSRVARAVDLRSAQ